MNRWRLPLAIALAAIVAACDGGAASDTTAPGVETTVGVANTQPSTDDTEPRTDDTTTDDTEPRTDDTSTDVTEPRTDDTGSATADTGADGGETIVDVAAGTGRFATLLSVIEATGLTEELAGAGPYTLFAPTDDAFAELPDGTLEELLADPAQLESLLLYHVVPGEYQAADLVTESSLATAEGSDLPVTVEGETVMVGDAIVVETDITAGNGVIHVIDKVLSPPERLGG